MMRIVFVLLALWVVLTVVGFVVKSLFWLAVVGLVLFAGTAAYGAIRRNEARRSLR
ncbi:hypothetical protein [Pseudonocardia sp.]|uniref:hypothetical protein n=1 Tax=Pseudonocardia sp. TaxID=60912 RepID=UPI00261CF6C5|nr:hypothetical protein [Pseudonocardia sp.]